MMKEPFKHTFTKSELQQYYYELQAERTNPEERLATLKITNPAYQWINSFLSRTPPKANHGINTAMEDWCYRYDKTKALIDCGYR